MAEVKARLKLRQGPAGTWAALNPVLLVGEPGYETDTKRLRIGDGVTAFTSLPAVILGAPPPAWDDISGRPAAFPPAAHTHLASGISDSSVIGQDLLKAPDLAAIWTLLYLGSLAGKNKISVPGDINASGTGADWSVLHGDGVWRSIFGLGVQWLDLTASRAKDTVYQNANGRAIAVTVTSSGGFIDRQLQVSADNTTWRTISDFNFSGTSTVTGVVPSGHYYRFVSTGTMFRWMELRS